MNSSYISLRIQLWFYKHIYNLSYLEYKAAQKYSDNSGYILAARDSWIRAEKQMQDIELELQLNYSHQNI
jgi:hypothetical protein